MKYDELMHYGVKGMRWRYKKGIQIVPSGVKKAKKTQIVEDNPNKNVVLTGTKNKKFVAKDMAREDRSELNKKIQNDFEKVKAEREEAARKALENSIKQAEERASKAKESSSKNEEKKTTTDPYVHKRVRKEDSNWTKIVKKEKSKLDDVRNSTSVGSWQAYAEMRKAQQRRAASRNK